MKKPAVTGIVLIAIILIIALISLSSSASKKKAIYDTAPTEISLQLKELQAREIEELGSYKLLDSSKIIYRIPIDSAIKLIVEEGS